jgi:predicted transcriptional regulator
MAEATETQASKVDEVDVIDLTAGIVSAYVSHNTVSAAQIPELIAIVSSALRATLPGPEQPEPEPQKPAVPIRRSVTPEEIVCLECGRRFRSIRRHLRSAHGLEPADYRAKWGLARDYPLTAPNYAERRSALAKQIGLGRKKGESAPAGKGRGRRGAKAAAESPAG